MDLFQNEFGFLEYVFFSKLIIFLLVFLRYYKGYKFTFASDDPFTQERSIFKRGPMKFDKVQHAVWGFSMGMFGWWYIIIKVAYEILQGFLPYQKFNDKSKLVRIFVGDGFSLWDLVFGIFGLALGIGTYEFIVEIFTITVEVLHDLF